MGPSCKIRNSSEISDHGPRIIKCQLLAGFPLMSLMSSYPDHNKKKKLRRKKLTTDLLRLKAIFRATRVGGL